VSWLQLELSTTSDEVDALEDLLIAQGAVALTLQSDNDERVLEPLPGQTPLWKVIRLLALFELSVDLGSVRSALKNLSTDFDVQFIGSEDWQQYARTFAITQIFGGRLLLRPPLDEGENPNDDIATLYLEPGLAFGSGSHPTTRLCLEWLANNVQPHQKVLDFGCGSGVLAIAAALLGCQAMGVDHDEQAIVATRDNATANGLTKSDLDVCDLSGWYERTNHNKYDVVVANILAEPLKVLANEFQRVITPGGSIVLSGILREQASEVMAAYEHTTFESPVERGDWVCLQGVVHG
jgi:ribosomal protein L11 methyltransferase